MNPEDLLAQIRTLLEAYLDMGENTPVAAEARVLASAIDAAGASPEAGGAMPPEGGDVPPPPGESLGPPTEGYSGGDMGEARAGAKDFLQRRRAKAV